MLDNKRRNTPKYAKRRTVSKDIVITSAYFGIKGAFIYALVFLAIEFFFLHIAIAPPDIVDFHEARKYLLIPFGVVGFV